MNPLGFQDDGAPLEIDLDRLIGSHACIIANSGGGKSGLVRKLLETTHGRIQHIVLDVDDEFYTLRERFDYVIAGGADSDVAASVEAAPRLARLALERGFSLIVQLNDLGAAAPALVRGFIEGLMSAPRELWHPLLLVLDEAQRMVSAKTPTEALPAVADLLFRGRKRGFTAVLASLRMADGIAPEIRGMANNWLLGRSGQALDRNTMADQLGFTAREGRERLRGMEPRMFWGMGPAIAAEPVLFRVDDAETSIVRAGQARAPTPPPPEALRDLLAALAAEPAAAAQPEPKNAPICQPAERDELLGRIVALEDERDTLIGETIALGKRADLAEDRGYGRGLAAGIGIGLTRARLVIDNLTVPDLIAAIPAGPADVEPPAMPPAGETDRPGSPPPGRSSPSRDAVLPAEGEPTPFDELPRALPPRRIRILSAVRWAEEMLKKPAVPRRIVAWMADTSPASSGFEKDLGAMRTAGLIDYPEPGCVALTAAGRDLAPAVDAPTDRKTLWKAIAAKLPPRQVELIDALFDGAAETRDLLARKVGKSPRSSGFEKDLGRLRTLGLIDYPETGRVRLAELLR